jgi:hypothetical protein
MNLSTECSKCGAAMPALARASHGWLSNVKLVITGYLCKECGNWNNLKKRKWWREKEKQVRGNKK